MLSTSSFSLITYKINRCGIFLTEHDLERKLSKDVKGKEKKKKIHHGVLEESCRRKGIPSSPNPESCRLNGMIPSSPNPSWLPCLECFMAVDIEPTMKYSHEPNSWATFYYKWRIREYRSLRSCLKKLRKSDYFV